ncbi:hypothetical protein [Paraglaciecola sp. L3A3]|uniref:hypothetical protein n=1 Tax=Paraglaciecola sp. L3A3 TaxID=2686358 RepID=UPI00131B1534|nr:hypothetical protein [Paraglaciecola sp. L3A3]
MKALIIALLLYSGYSASANNSILVVANTAITNIELNRQEVRNLFMGSSLSYGLSAIALPPNNHTRILFNTKIVGLTESRIQAYWAQMKFTGRKKAPKELADEQLVLDYLENNQGAVGYLPSYIKIPNGLTILYEID